VVSLISQDGQKRLYRGGAWRSAYDAYWQAIRLVRHFLRTATVRMDLTEEREPFGGFVTEIEDGQDKSLHIPYEECLKWAYRKWTTQNTPEKILSMIPGMLRPVRHQRQSPPD
jgi:hypothetical protein